MNRILRSILVIIISNSLIFSPLLASAAENLALPAGDIIAPVIKYKPTSTTIAPGQLVELRATVTDNVGVKDVILFYRDTGAVSFERTKMMQEIGTDDFSTTLPAIMGPGIEYYIQATDRAGNTILRGHTISPLTLTVSSDAEPQIMVTAPAQAPREKPPKRKTNKWVWVGLGVLAVGVVAIAGGGGGSSGGGDTPTPTSGTVLISGPTP